MALIVLRICFLIVSAGAGVFALNRIDLLQDWPWRTWTAIGGSVAVAVTIIAFDMLVRRKNVTVISAVYFGLIVGLFLTYVVMVAIESLQLADQTRDALVLPTAVALCYVCISLLIQTRDQFRFVIPYVEFAKERKGPRPYLLDTSAIIDGRIADVVETHLLDSQLVMPVFALAELQAIADSSDRQRRTRGRRGLDILNRLRGLTHIDLTIDNQELPEFANQPVDAKLVILAKHLQAKLVTTDFNLNKIAQLHGITVVNLHDLANAMKPKFLPGDHVDVRIVRVGEGVGQGVGYLDDGTMVVIEGGRNQIDHTVAVTITSTLQTSAGRMVFGRYDEPKKA